MTGLKKLMSSDLRGILFMVEDIDPAKFDTLATRNFRNTGNTCHSMLNSHLSCDSKTGWLIVPK